MQLFAPIYNRLIGSTAITDIVGDKIFFSRAEQGAATPYIVINQVSATGSETKSGPSTVDKNRVQIDAYSSDAETVVNLSELIRQRLEYYQGTSAGVYLDGAVYDNEETGFDEESDAHRLRVDYFIRYKR